MVAEPDMLRLRPSDFETFDLILPEDARLLLLRLTDAHHNVVTFDLTGHLP